MPSRVAVAEELADIFKAIAHPDRIRLVEALRHHERGVTALAEALNLRSTRVSQHLALLKAHKLVEERREGRHHYYRLSQPQLADWIIDALSLVEGRLEASMAETIEKARSLWSPDSASAETPDPFEPVQSSS